MNQGHESAWRQSGMETFSMLYMFGKAHLFQGNTEELGTFWSEKAENLVTNPDPGRMQLKPPEMSRMIEVLYNARLSFGY